MEHSKPIRLIVALIRELRAESEVIDIITQPTRKERKYPHQELSSTGTLMQYRVPIDSIIERNKQIT